VSHDFRQVIKRFYRMYALKDRAAALELFDPNVEMHAAENFVYASTVPYVGLDNVRNLIFDRMAADWEEFSAVAEEILGVDDVVIARGRYRGTYKATGTTINAEFVHVFRFKNGKIASWQSYTDTAQFKDAIAGKGTTAQ
jgi:uncharacterized protein